MCGIVGYVGEQQALPIILEGLRKLEYRGYDSAGVAGLVGGAVQVVKSVGPLQNLEQTVNGNLEGACIGIGHTRWATHGRPTVGNAHPHIDCSGRFVIVHNGIIENYLQIKEELVTHGHIFRSETDTEVIPHLLEAYYEGDLVAAVRKVCQRLRGAYVLAALCRDEPDKIAAARMASPLVVGLSAGENFLASDIPALLKHTRRVLVLEDGELAVLTRGGVAVLALDGRPVHRPPVHVDWEPGRAEKGGYHHFMLKEIHEQPQALADTLRGRLRAGRIRPVLDELAMTAKEVRTLEKVVMVGCGSAAHAGLVGKYLIETLARIPVEWDIASEYRYRAPMVNAATLVIAISQSGETADTLAAVREARRLGARTLAISNVVGATIPRESDAALYTRAGPEIAVASTKAYTTQVALLALLAIWLGRRRRTLSATEAAGAVQALCALPEQAARVLEQEDRAADVAHCLARQHDAFFMGRHLDYAVAMEGQLKLKEISYIHAEAYAAGELKHGTLALIARGTPVIALNTQGGLLSDKTISNIQEVRAREAQVFAVTAAGDISTAKHADRTLFIPRTLRWLTPVLSVLPLQLIAYYAAVARGHDPDRPRNLAKSVTVE